ncbi:hypothetical protein [Streptomyces clavuligerus]|uniref:Putative membrane protein n=1 Tax=Streptomyces clavuligerus TaxID=1901 RepID=E2PVA0_STRCL|nr:hypothetical protein [Streptomyces clavuligerus]ANW21070.1 hypothetical protein BB341_24105 [Streptomyces clavuligerus]AXU15689.1 hypothetical protein D1794_25045 [Streptomyces clavuligerus]EFG05847.1 Putative membrane protein [Streptomyces clavuligerus]MBY6305808.1 hypothetical protein [Streptomyces clavuligerus]QCS08468.1 hypothetical protein CRV15_24415 [Streptomyces clavuligerus]
MIAETLCAAVSVAGLGIAGITAYRRRFLAAARIAAYSLVPLGLVLTGAVAWAVDTAFSPTAWIGFGVLGGAWALFATTRAVERRSGVPGRKERKAAAAAARRGAVAPEASAPSLGRGTAAPAGGKSGGRTGGRTGGKAAPDEDFSDIEAILKKHGI